MRSAGTPIMIADGVSTALRRERIGGKDGSHDERWLQQLLNRHPSCIPMDQIEPGLPALVSICMELPLASGYLDNLFMSPEGDIVIVEAKLWRNPQAQREVVAQALDYANTLFGMDYEALEEAICRADFDGNDKPVRLYDLFSDADTLDEPDFVDAVTTNLRNGRIVVLVVGDGIRTGAESLVEGLQSHAGFHFTFALVELAVYRCGEDDNLIAVPRTLLKTYMVERGIVRIDDGKLGVQAFQSKQVSSARHQSITSEQFFEAMRNRHPELPGQIGAFLDRLAPLGVYPEFKRSLNIKWDPPTGNTINLGYVKRDGQLWTDVTNWNAGDPLISQAYVADFAKQIGGDVVVRDKGNDYVTVDGKAPNIEHLLGQFDCWYDVIERYLLNVREHIASGQTHD